MTDLNDLRESFFDEEEMMRSIINNALRGEITKLPVEVVEDSADGNTVKLKSNLKLPRQKEDGTTEWVEPPEFHDVIVKFPGAGGFSKTFPIKKGDEGFIHFGSRGISNWHEKGGVQQAVSMRGGLSDGSFELGGRSKPKKLKGVSKDSTQTRSDDKKSVSDVSNTAVSSVREDSAHQVNGMAIQAQKGGSSHVVDKSTVQSKGKKILLNCAGGL